MQLEWKVCIDGLLELSLGHLICHVFMATIDSGSDCLHQILHRKLQKLLSMDVFRNLSLQVPGALLLRDNSGNVYAVQTDNLQQVH